MFVLKDSLGEKNDPLGVIFNEFCSESVSLNADFHLQAIKPSEY